jgi:hypothetical protein
MHACDRSNDSAKHRPTTLSEEICRYLKQPSKYVLEKVLITCLQDFRQFSKTFELPRKRIFILIFFPITKRLEKLKIIKEHSQ